MTRHALINAWRTLLIILHLLLVYVGGTVGLVWGMHWCLHHGHPVVGVALLLFLLVSLLVLED